MTYPTTLDGSRRGLLAQTLQELLTVAVRLRTNPQSPPPDAEQLRANVHQRVAAAGSEGKQLGYRDEDLGYAMYAVVAYLDESVLGLSAPSLASWQGRPLQEELFRVHVGGDVFFSYLETLLAQQNSEDLADVLEVYQLCLLLGFKGRYGGSRQEELHQWTARLRDRVTEIRGPLGVLAPQWEPSRSEQLEVRRDEWQRRLRAAIVGVAALTVVLLLVFTLVLGSRTGSIVAAR